MGNSSFYQSKNRAELNLKTWFEHLLSNFCYYHTDYLQVYLGSIIFFLSQLSKLEQILKAWGKKDGFAWDLLILALQHFKLLPFL